MKFLGFCLCAASALVLAGCGQHKQAAARQTPPTAKAAPAVGIKVADAEPVSTASSSEAPAPAPAQRRAAPSARRAGAATVRRRQVRFRTHLRQGAPLYEEAVDTTDEADREWGPKRYSAEYETCVSSAHGYTAGRADCFNAELARQGERVDRAYRAALVTRTGVRKQRLLEAQRGWTRLRDTRCRDDLNDSTVDVLHEGSCRLDMTVRRAIELENMKS